MAVQTGTVEPLLGIKAARCWFPEKTRRPQDEVRTGNLTAEQAARQETHRRRSHGCHCAPGGRGGFSSRHR